MKTEQKEKLPKVPLLKDITQNNSPLEVPEIRVWCHPERIGKSGDDYYHTFSYFSEALLFCATHDEAEEIPLIAFRGYEINIFDIEVPI